MLTGELIESGLMLANQDTREMKKEVKRILQNCYYRIAAMTDWIDMRNVVSKAIVATNTSGVYLPSDLIGVLGVVCETSGSEQVYEETSEERRMMPDGRHHWYHPTVRVSPLDDLKKGITIEESASVFSGSLGADRTGEYIRFASEPGYYLIGASSAISPVYWGPRLNNKGAVTRPTETRKHAIVDGAGDFDANTVKIFYWQWPSPLYRDSDRPLIPDTRALELMMWIDIIGPLEKRNREAKEYRKELLGPQEDGTRGALADLMAMNPKFLSPGVPRARNGSILKFVRRR